MSLGWKAQTGRFVLARGRSASRYFNLVRTENTPPPVLQLRLSDASPQNSNS